MISNLKFTQATKTRGCVIQLQEELIPTEVPCDKPQASQWHQSCLNLGWPWEGKPGWAMAWCWPWPWCGERSTSPADWPICSAHAQPRPSKFDFATFLGLRTHTSANTNTKRMKIQKLNTQGQLTIPYTLIYTHQHWILLGFFPISWTATQAINTYW